MASSSPDAGQGQSNGQRGTAESSSEAEKSSRNQTTTPHLQLSNTNSFLDPSSSEFYPSPSLHLSLREFRLLHLAPAWDIKARIECLLSVNSLHDDKLEYEALSYTWGTSKLGRTVNVNGWNLPVTDNLDAALRRLRKRDTIRTLWVDALCINQLDIAERNIQVAEMGKIYRFASGVIVWLGDANASSEQSGLRIYEVGRFGVPIFDKRKFWSSQIQSLREAIANTSPSWWHRAWVVQEYVIALTQPNFAFGPHIVPGSRFLELLSDIVEHDVVNSALASSFYATVTSFDKIRSKIGSDASSTNDAYSRPLQTGDHVLGRKIEDRMRPATCLDLSELLLLTYSTTASDPRDKVYSLLALMSTTDLSHLRVDYRHSVGQVYACATYTAIASYGFGFLRYRKIRQHDHSLPSWTIDLQHWDLHHLNRDAVSPLSSIDGVHKRRRFMYCQAWLDYVHCLLSDLPNPEYLLSDNLDSLQCFGLFMGTVDAVDQVVRAEGSSQWPWDAWNGLNTHPGDRAIIQLVMRRKALMYRNILFPKKPRPRNVATRKQRKEVLEEISEECCKAVRLSRSNSPIWARRPHREYPTPVVPSRHIGENDPGFNRWVKDIENTVWAEALHNRASLSVQSPWERAAKHCFFHNLEPWTTYVEWNAMGATRFVTTTGIEGFSLGNAKKGDLVFLLDGCAPGPVLLREAQAEGSIRQGNHEESRHSFEGFTYVPDMSVVLNGKCERRKIGLV